MTPLERIRSALEAHDSRRHSANGWQCPAHQDRRASLSVTEGQDGRALLHCHAGCAPDQVVGALGLTLQDLFPPRTGLDGPWAASERKTPGDSNAHAGPPGETRRLNQIGTSIGTTGHETIVATYDYLDERGTLLYQVVRLAPKGFRQRRPGSNGRWVWNLKGTRRVLYRLPAVVAAISRGETIWVAEGEKDVHALEQAGVTATCNPMGAGKWRPEYTDTLATAEPSTWITLVADSDEAGHRHATDVAQRLQQAGCTVRLVQPAHGKDAHDHLAAGLGLDQFQPLDPATLQQTAAAGGPTVQDLVDTLASYQHLDDPGHVWFALAVAISSAAFDDEPLWGMLVGAPSSGKTETARALGNIAGHIDDLTAAGLLTWTRGKDPKPSGALMRIGKRGLTTIGDFSTVLAQSNKGNRDLLYS